ncbi:hypothetical protein PIB30_042390 [Stylosanthes scabra]|uniref:Uncharacterized protein n=1 Tax=Stylosanthes scabra TaxID=79078 RepID=A0ABU6XGN9_9FABA|nr:hypothetical protein [Stylosanthes scabra]
MKSPITSRRIAVVVHAVGLASTYKSLLLLLSLLVRHLPLIVRRLYLEVATSLRCIAAVRVSQLCFRLVRRMRITDRIRKLQELMPNMDKVIGFQIRGGYMDMFWLT